MKIGILSMQRVINYGSVLQAYSLKEVIQSCFQNAEIDFIDIDSSSVLEFTPLIKGSSDYCIPYGGKRNIVTRIKGKAFRYLLKKNNYMIRLFADRNFVSKNDSNEYDFAVIGSDEVLNSCNGLNLQLHGEISNAKKIITYAASCGAMTAEEIPLKYHERIRKAMDNISNCSVRDEGTRKYVECFYTQNIEHHLDPVLVGDLYKRNWKPVPLKKYLVVYAYGERIRDKAEIQAIQEFAKKNRLKTVCIGGVQNWCDLFVPVDPFRMLDYFASAEYVVTDTFHGTIFSIITKRKFATIYRKTNYNKLSNLLLDLSVEDRGLSNMDCLENVLKRDIDYVTIEKVLAQERERTKRYITDALQ